ncbi:MAG TPA: hypothetical protein VK890_02630 [Bacteroidia bacterium]|nr:hypothetical protein [Bacteroidia bacterium]
MKVSPSALGSTRNAFEKFKMFSMVCFEGPATFFLPPFFGEFEEAGVIASMLEIVVEIVFFCMFHYRFFGY